jgi:hypothetical protein
MPQSPSLVRTEGDSEDPLRGQVFTRTGLSTTVGEDLSGASVFITIWAEDNLGTPLTTFNDVQIPAPDITVPLTGEFDYILSPGQVAELLATSPLKERRYLMKLRVVFPSGKQRFYPNDLTPDGTSVMTHLVLVVVPGI